MQQLAHQLVQGEQERVGSDSLVQGIRGEGEPSDLVWEGSPPLAPEDVAGGKERQLVQLLDECSAGWRAGGGGC